MFRLRSADAIATLRQIIAEIPSDLDARAGFFVQWRCRAIQSLELIFDQEHEPVRQFKEIEFSPRRLTKNETKDARLKLDAYLSGCAAAKAHIESLITTLATVPAAPQAADATPPASETVPAPRLKLDTSDMFPCPVVAEVLVAEAVEKVSEPVVAVSETIEPAPVAQEPQTYDLRESDEDDLSRLLQRIEWKLDQVLAGAVRVA
jgi:hypothetical protein